MSTTAQAAQVGAQALGTATMAWTQPKWSADAQVNRRQARTSPTVTVVEDPSEHTANAATAFVRQAAGTRERCFRHPCTYSGVTTITPLRSDMTTAKRLEELRLSDTTCYDRYDCYELHYITTLFSFHWMIALLFHIIPFFVDDHSYIDHVNHASL